MPENKLVIPEINSLWLHTNGSIYEVYDITNVTSNRPDEYPTRVSYINVETGEKYSKDLLDWYKNRTLVPNTHVATNMLGIHTDDN